MDVKTEAAPDNQTPADISNNVTEPQTTPQVDTAEQKNESILTSDPAQDAKSTAPIDWPEDWREKAAKGDEKRLKQLQRYASPVAALEALDAAQKKISSYKPEVTLPENPTEEDIAKYRKAHGIPETPDGYDLKLANGIVIGENDMPMVKKILESAHKRNAKPSEIKQVIQDYFEIQQAESEQINTRLKEQRTQAEDELRSEWGTNYRQNVNVINNFLQNKFGSEVAQALSGAVLSDGTYLASNPKVLRQFLAIANDIDPLATISGSPSSVTPKGMEARIAEIEDIMKYKKDEYRGPIVKEYEDLITARERLRARGAI